MTPLPRYSDLPPSVSKLIEAMERRMQAQLRLTIGLSATLATGLVALTTFCLTH